MWKGLLVFCLILFVNIFYIYYLNAVKDDKPILASMWASFVNLSLNMSAIFYVQEHWILIPSFLGAFVGTFVALNILKKINK